MSSKKVRLCAFALIAVLLFGFSSVALATATKPYKQYGCHFYTGRDDLGTAFTDRCSCNPVDNYLAARVKIQYRTGDQYKTTSWSSWATGSDVETKYVRQTGGAGTYCNYIYGEHKAQCGSGKRCEMSSDKSR